MAPYNRKFELSPRLKFGVGRGYSQNRMLKIATVACLVLAIGLAANAVRLMFTNQNDPQSIINEQPQVLGAFDAQTENLPSGVQFVDYQVQKGDTLFNISQQFKIKWTTLATLNNLKSPFTVKPGQILKVPK